MRKNQKTPNKKTPEVIIYGLIMLAFRELCRKKIAVDGKPLSFDSITNRYVNEWLRETLKELVKYSREEKLLEYPKGQVFLNKLETDLNNDQVIMFDIRKELEKSESIFRGFFDSQFYKLYAEIWKTPYFSLNKSIRSTEKELKFTKEIFDKTKEVCREQQINIIYLAEKNKNLKEEINNLTEELKVKKKELKVKEALIKTFELSFNYIIRDSDSDNEKSVLDRMKQPFKENIKLIKTKDTDGSINNLQAQTAAGNNETNNNANNGSENVIQLNLQDTANNENGLQENHQEKNNTNNNRFFKLPEVDDPKQSKNDDKIDIISNNSNNS